MKSQVLLLSFPLLLLAFLAHDTSLACDLGVYWGQTSKEGNLTQACDTKNYTIIVMQYLYTYGNFQRPKINLAGHCPSTTTCLALEEEIKHCQSLGVKIFLSLGGGASSLVSDDDAANLAEYIWNLFLGGTADDRVFGDAVLDGIDFDIESGSSLYYDTVVKELASYNSQAESKKVLLGASPQCIDYYEDEIIATGLLDYIWVQFDHNTPCDYSNPSGFFDSWNTWSKKNATSILLGLPASANFTSTGYIQPSEMINVVLPEVQKAEKYGGVMLWNRYWDSQSGYSAIIKDATCPKASQCEQYGCCICPMSMVRDV